MGITSVKLRLTVLLLFALMGTWGCRFADMSCATNDPGCMPGVYLLYVVKALPPDAVAGLQLWLRADALAPVADGTAIANWPDSSVLRRDGVQANATNQPLYFANQLYGRPALVFDGTDILATPAISIDAFTMLAVFSLDVSGNFTIYEHGTDTNGAPGHYLASSDVYTTLVNRTQLSGKQLVPDWASPNRYRVTTQIFNRTHATNGLYIDGVMQNMSDPVDQSDPVGGAVNAPVFLGARSGPLFGITGKLAEVILYDSALNDATRSGVECYLSNKYALAVPGCQ